MAKFCIYDNQIAVIEEALRNGGKKEIAAALDVLIVVRDLYAIAGISKEDVAAKAFDDCDKIDLITDDDMEEIASDMGNAYIENGYWIDLQCMIDDKEIALKCRME
jgi:hypothetical protein